MRKPTKKVVAKLAKHSIPIVDYRNSVFVLSHMRSMSTALTNVLSSHERISGYGETHVSYSSPHSVGQLAVNLMLRRAWTPTCRFLLDKILHNELDAFPDAGFYDARAVFLVRSPAPAIASVVNLAQRAQGLSLETHEEAAVYYRDRLRQLRRHWRSFTPARRFGLTSEDLVTNPNNALARIGDYLGLVPPLRNAYRSHPASRIAGGGDPLRSGALKAIEPRSSAMDLSPVAGVPEHLSDECITIFQNLKNEFSEKSLEPVARVNHI
ncbi:sulfotransferase family protein [Cognatishimia activa]|uniref:Sulfotransferase family protein n=1 Tax=Cognatishimia activa TaxID=1715691 RepID=A0A0P1IUY2_9RHOB|nr:sulfotransferase [Cognatishimia activa]CUI51602.1 hypothetical protein TA5113_00669 [Cognatishimia activa]CUK27324.1 hypothetical protein TA5114_03152 [Cognatishimia activa]